jgi:HAD superfamily hydrolase (TIGR01509 family)
MVLIVSDSALPPGQRPPRTADPGRSGRRFDAVLFDFHGTLALMEEPVAWVTAAARACGTRLDRAAATSLADRLLVAGRAGDPTPARIPPHLAEAYADRDLDPGAHRTAFTGLAATVDSGIDGLPEALYERIVHPDGWVVAPDVVPTLAALRAAGVPVAVVSNIGFDLRPILRRAGVDDLVDYVTLSYEVGRTKPDPVIFLTACAALRTPPQRALMVGDTPADAGAVRAGCHALVLPLVEPGRPTGLRSVLDLVGVSPNGAGG